MSEAKWRVGDIYTDGQHRWQVVKVHQGEAVLQSCSDRWAQTNLLMMDEWLGSGRWVLQSWSLVPNDVRVDIYSGGNTTLKVTHLPTGIVVSRSQILGDTERLKRSALEELESKVAHCLHTNKG